MAPVSANSDLIKVTENSKKNTLNEQDANSTPRLILNLECEGHQGISIQLHKKASEKEIRNNISRGFGFTSDQQFYAVSNIGLVLLDLQACYLEKFNSLTIVKGSLKLEIVPSPNTIPILGNVLELIDDWVSGTIRFHKIHGPILKFKVFSVYSYSITDADIVGSIINESPFFKKRIKNVLNELKRIGGSGLFTTESDEPSWILANKLLKPAFGFTPMKSFMPMMHETTMKLCSIFDQLLGKPIPILKWFTNFAFSTIGICGFGYDFHLFDSTDMKMHPFIEAMNYTLTESLKRSFFSKVKKSLTVRSNMKFSQAMTLMQDTVDNVITSRKSIPDPQKKDLLNFMLLSKDENGNQMETALIRDEVITFLIAGHETTANLLTWCMSLVSERPDVEAKLLEEALIVCGKDANVPITPDQLSKLQYTTQVLKETLRLYPPVPAIIKEAVVPTTVGNGFYIDVDCPVNIFCVGLHRNPEYWGNAPNVFNPDNFSPENEKNRHKYAYLPFSLGDRSCIGISFALQESKIALATLIRKYQFGRVDMDTVRYDPKSITMKPLNLEMRIQTRTHFNPPSINIKDYSVNSDQPLQPAPLIAFKYRGELPFIVFHFGSDMGTSEDFARQMYQTAKNYNLKQVDIQVLDSQLQFDSKAIHVIIVSTYNGEPPANAKKFKEFIASAAPETMKGVRFAVYGCGNSQWRTFQKVPMFIDHQMELLGGTRIMPIGNGDANEDIETHFYAWQAKFWLMLQEEHGFYPNENETHPLLTSMSSAVKINDIGKAIEFSTPPSLSKYPSAQNLSTSVAVSVLYQNIEGNIKELKLMSRGDLWKVDSKQELINPVAGLPQKSVFHIVLSGNTPYNTGDHFELWPENSISHVQAIAELLQCDLDTVIKLENVVAPTKSVAFQVRGPFTIRDCFKNHCDFLGQPSKFLIETMLLKQNERDKAAKIRMQDISLYQHYTSLYRRTLDVFLNANVKWTLEDVLCGCNKITPRLFSVASCREYSGEAVHLCISVTPDGFCSNFLKYLQPCMEVCGGIRPAPSFFHLPSDSSTPIVLICAGTGISPFLGFLHARLMSEPRGDIYFFYGCRHPNHDYLFSSLLEKFKEDGVIKELHVAFSRYTQLNNHKYVQDAIKNEAKKLGPLLSPESNAAFYVCGSAKSMAKDVASTFEESVYPHMPGSILDDPSHAQKYMALLRDQKRYVEDVWG